MTLKNRIAKKIADGVNQARICCPRRTLIRCLGSQELAEVALLLERRRKRVHKTGVNRAVVVEAVHVDEPERFAPFGNLRNGPAHGSTPIILGQRQFLIRDCRYAGKKEVPRVQLIVGEEIVDVAMQLVGAGFRGIGDKTAASVSVLCGKGILDDCHFLHGGVGHRAFLRPLVTFRIAESRAVKPILRGHGLAAVDPRRKLAAAENRVAVRLHGHKARL